jgi:hypothetical protein
MRFSHLVHATDAAAINATGDAWTVRPRSTRRLLMTLEDLSIQSGAVDREVAAARKRLCPTGCSSSRTATAGDGADAGSGDWFWITVTLPPAITASVGKECTVKRTGASGCSGDDLEPDDRRVR